MQSSEERKIMKCADNEQLSEKRGGVATVTVIATQLTANWEGRLYSCFISLSIKDGKYIRESGCWKMSTWHALQMCHDLT